MALKKLSKQAEELLRRASDSRDAKSYADWLSGTRSTAADLAHAELSRNARRASVDYGTGGEALAAGDLADDGYAAYLRKAAKEAREAEHRRIEGERAGEQASALSEYASYLDSERAKKADRLVNLAEELRSSRYTTETAEDLIERAGAGATAEALLRDHQRYGVPYEETAEGREEVAKVLSHLRLSGMSYKSAYEYCRLLGYGELMAGRLARFATSEQDGLGDELKDLTK